MGGLPWRVRVRTPGFQVPPVGPGHPRGARGRGPGASWRVHLPSAAGAARPVDPLLQRRRPGSRAGGGGGAFEEDRPAARAQGTPGQPGGDEAVPREVRPAQHPLERGPRARPGPAQRRRGGDQQRGGLRGVVQRPAGGLPRPRRVRRRRAPRHPCNAGGGLERRAGRAGAGARAPACAFRRLVPRPPRDRHVASGCRPRGAGTARGRRTGLDHRGGGGGRMSTGSMEGARRALSVAWMLALREWRALLRQSRMAAVWPLVQPLAYTALLVALRPMFGMGAAGAPLRFGVFVFIGFILWQSWFEVMRAEMDAIRRNKGLMSRGELGVGTLVLSTALAAAIQLVPRLLVGLAAAVFVLGADLPALLMLVGFGIATLVNGAVIGALLQPFSTLSPDLGKTIQSFA